MKKILAALLALIMLFCSLSMLSCSSERVVMSFEGYKVTEDMYRYWMISWKEYYLNYYSDVEDTEKFWNGENVQGGTNEEYLTEQTEQRIKYYLVGQALFEQHKLTLDSDEKDAIKTDIDEQIEYYGSRSAFNSHLEEVYGIDVNVLKNIYTWEAKYNKVYTYLFDPENGIMTANDKEVDEYYNENYVRIKYVMFFKKVKYAYDEDGKKKTDANGRYVFIDLTEKEQADVVEKVNKIFGEVSGGAEIDEYVKNLMPEFGYDVSAYPNGFYITADEYSLHTATVTTAALEMDVGEVRLAESEDTFFIIEKFDLIDKAYVGQDQSQFTYLVSYCNSYKFVKHFNSLSKDLDFDESIREKYKLSQI